MLSGKVLPKSGIQLRYTALKLAECRVARYVRYTFVIGASAVVGRRMLVRGTRTLHAERAACLLVAASARRDRATGGRVQVRDREI